MNFPLASVAPLNSDQLATVDRHGNVTIFSRSNGSISRSLKGSEAIVQCVAINPGTGILVTGIQGGDIQLKDLTNGGEVFRLEENVDLTALKKSLQQRFPLSLMPKIQTFAPPLPPKAEVLHVLFSHHETYMAAFYREPDLSYYLRVWKVVGQQWTRIHQTFLENEKSKLQAKRFTSQDSDSPRIRWEKCALSPDGKSIASVNQQGICLLKIAKNSYRDFPMANVTAIAYSSDGKMVVCGTSQGDVRFISFYKKKQPRIFAIQCHSNEITAIAFKPDDSGKYVIADRDRKLIFRSANHSKPLAILSLTRDVDHLIWERHANGSSSLIASSQTALFYFEVNESQLFDARLLWKSEQSPSEQKAPEAAASVAKPPSLSEHPPVQSKRSGKLKRSEGRDFKKEGSAHPSTSAGSAVTAQTAPSLSPSMGAKGKMSPFPTAALDKMLKFVKEIDLIQMLNNTAKGEKTTLFSRLSSYFNPASVMTDIIAANLTWSNIFSLSKVVVSKAGFITFVQIINDVYNGRGISTETYQGKTQGILESLEELQAYVNQFYVTIQSVPQLDQQALILAILKDRELNKLLNEAKMIDQLADILSAAQVLKFGKQEAVDFFSLIKKAQELMYTIPDFEKIADYADLTSRLLGMQVSKTLTFMQDLLLMLKKLQEVIEAYVLPLTLPIERVAFPHICGVLKGTPIKKLFLNPAFEKGKEWTDVKTMFESFRSAETGMLFHTPVAAYIHERKLNHFSFSGDGKMSFQDAEEVIPNVKNGELFFGHAFESFSFNGGRFKDIRFRSLYLENCDFTGAAFEGALSFSEVYIDATTAKTLMPALSRALHRGKCSIEGNQGIILISLLDKTKNISQTIPKRLSKFIRTDFANWLEYESSDSDSSSSDLSRSSSSSDLSQSCEEQGDGEPDLFFSVISSDEAIVAMPIEEVPKIVQRGKIIRIKKYFSGF